MGPVFKIELNRNKFLKFRNCVFLAQTHEIHIKKSHIIVFYHFAKSRDMTSRCPLFWQAFVRLIFGSKVQAQATVLLAFEIAKIEEQTTTIMKILGP